jgi:exoribonuclease R
MTRRTIRVAPVAALEEGFEAIRQEAGVSVGFSAAAEAEAQAAVHAPRTNAERADFPFVTIDPPGSRDLDQAMHLERRADGGHRVRYAIADVAAFVTPGGAIDQEAHARGVTVYLPDRKAPLHPTVLSEGAASLLPGQWTPAILWTLDLDATGALTSTHVARATVRSVAQYTYADVPAELTALLAEIGGRRRALERERGGVDLDVPEQEVACEDGSWTVEYRAPLAVEEDNAQISLLTGMAAARLMLDAGTGILRTQPAPDARSLQRLRLQARALGAEWPETTSYQDFIRGLDPTRPAHAALLQEATTVGHGAGYTVFDGQPPAEHQHFAIAADYAHATAPLRRLQDRFVSECCLAACASTPVPDWVHAGLPDLPAAMAAGAHRAGKVERGVVDLVEAALLTGREDEIFDAVVVDEKLVQLTDPAVRGRLTASVPAPGSAVRVRLLRADVTARTVEFAIA